MLQGAVISEVNPINRPRQMPKFRLHRARTHAGSRSYLGACLVMVIVTFAARVLEATLPVGELTLVFMAGVVVVASFGGPGPSILASFAGFAAYNYFFTEPRFTFRVLQEADLVTLGLFLLASIVTGSLAARLRTRAMALRGSVERITILHEFAQQIARAPSSQAVAHAAVDHVTATMGVEVALFRTFADAVEKIAYSPALAVESEGIKEACGRTIASGEPVTVASNSAISPEWLILPVRAGEETLAVLGIRSKAIERDDRRLLEAFASQLALAFERTDLTETLEAARLATETERLRSALLSSVSHDLRTPLVSIIGAASTLAEGGDRYTEPMRQDLAETIREEGERLDRYVQNLLDMTRLSHGALRPRCVASDLLEIIGNARRRLRSNLAPYKIVLSLPDSMPLIDVDPILIEQLLVNVLDNAAKYAPENSEILLSGHAESTWLKLAISDQGPGIPAQARSDVFEMFYRVTAGDTQRAGTGLGLAIARGIVDAHDGDIYVQATNPDESGTTIVFRLPIAGQEV